MKAIRDAHLRRHALAGMLSEGEPFAWVAVLADLLARVTTTDDADAQEAVECLAHAVSSDVLAYDDRVALYAAARNAGEDAVARLFLDASPAADKKLREPDQPLGVRKSLARSTRRDVLVPLLRDPHPDVIAILLDNPKLTERDAVIISAARPQAGSVLAVVADHARWSSRHAVKRALVLNPSTPVHLAVRIATTLKRADFVEIARDIHLPDALRAHATELLLTPKRPS